MSKLSLPDDAYLFSSAEALLTEMIIPEMTVTSQYHHRQNTHHPESPQMSDYNTPPSPSSGTYSPVIITNPNLPTLYIPVTDPSSPTYQVAENRHVNSPTVSNPVSSNHGQRSGVNSETPNHYVNVAKQQNAQNS